MAVVVIPTTLWALGLPMLIVSGSWFAGIMKSVAAATAVFPTATGAVYFQQVQVTSGA